MCGWRASTQASPLSGMPMMPLCIVERRRKPKTCAKRSSGGWLNADTWTERPVCLRAGRRTIPLRKSQSRRSRKHSIASSSVLDGLVVPAIHILRVALKTPTLRPIHTSGGPEIHGTNRLKGAIFSQMRIAFSSGCHKPTETAANDSPYIYPTVSQIRELHDSVIREHPDAECLGNLGNIVTCTTSEEVTRREGNDVFDTASSYARSIAQKRLFKDGNKRIALAASLVFLEINGVTDHDYYEPVLQEAILYLTKGDVSEEHFAQFLRHLFSEANSNLE